MAERARRQDYCLLLFRSVRQISRAMESSSIRGATGNQNTLKLLFASSSLSASHSFLFFSHIRTTGMRRALSSAIFPISIVILSSFLSAFNQFLFVRQRDSISMGVRAHHETVKDTSTFSCSTFSACRKRNFIHVTCVFPFECLAKWISFTLVCCCCCFFFWFVY